MFKKILAAIFLATALLSTAAKAGVEEGIDVRKVQRILAELCYKPGPIDGAWGKKTEAAVINLFKDKAREYDGSFGEVELFVLKSAHGWKTDKCKAVPNTEFAREIGDVTIYPNQIMLPDSLKLQPNDPTINHYIQYQERWMRRQPLQKISPSKQPRKIKSSLENHAFAQKELRDSSLLSYLYMENGVIIYDELPPKGRFKTDINNNTHFPSQSMGKSVTSYLIGHAICKGYINSVDTTLNDWKALENTLYFDQPLINLLNMKAGDATVIDEMSGNFKNSGRSIFDTPLILAINNEKELKDTKPTPNAKFSYSNLTSNILANYLMFKTGDNFDTFMRDFYHQKVKNSNPIYHLRTPTSNGSRNGSISQRIEDLTGRYSFWATRYDYLRIAISIMDDWQNETCEGKYLRDLYSRKVRTNRRQGSWNNHDYGGGNAQFLNASSRYAGQFWTDFKGLKGKVVLGMTGYNGQQIVMDMEKSRIVILNAAISNHYNTYKLGYEPLKYGRIR